MKTRIDWRLLLFIPCLVFFGACISMKKKPGKIYQQVTQNETIYDAVIIPGYPFEGEEWNDLMRWRVLWSFYLFQKGIVKNIIYSGAAVYTPYVESKIMGLYAQELGVPQEHIFYDTVAEHSTENVFYGYELARTQGFKTIAFATDPVQTSFLKGFIRRKFETDIQIIPIVFDSLTAYTDLNPTIKSEEAFVTHFKSLKERKNFWQRFKGTRGGNIPWKNKSKKAKAL